MLNSKTRDGDVSLYASVTLDDIKGSCLEWDRKLRDTISKLRDVTTVDTNGSNPSAEIWRVNLTMNAEAEKILSESPIVFCEAPHFGALF